MDVEKENPRDKRFSENNEYMALETGRYRNRIVDLQNAYIQGKSLKGQNFKHKFIVILYTILLDIRSLFILMT